MYILTTILQLTSPFYFYNSYSGLQLESSQLHGCVSETARVTYSPNFPAVLLVAPSQAFLSVLPLLPDIPGSIFRPIVPCPYLLPQ